jgi:hypothetical protein
VINVSRRPVPLAPVLLADKQINDCAAEAKVASPEME